MWKLYQDLALRKSRYLDFTFHMLLFHQDFAAYIKKAKLQLVL